MIVDRSHPMLRGCRLLVLPDSLGRLVNHMGIGTQATVPGSGVSLAAGTNGQRRLVFDNSGNNTVVFAGQRNYLRPVSGISVVFRCKVDGNSGGVEPGTNGIIGCRVGALSTTNSGWGFYHVSSGAPNLGMNWTVYGTGNSFNFVRDSAVSSFANSGRVHCGTYDHRTGRQSLYTNGLLISSATASPATFNLDTTSDIAIGGFPDGDFRLNGSVDFAAVFDRVLSPSEIARWSQTGTFPFLQSPGVNINLGSTVTYTSLVQARGILGVGGVAGAANYGNSIKVVQAVGGSISFTETPSAPAGVVVGRYSTGLGIRGPANGGTPVLSTFNTRINANSSATTAGIAAFATDVGVATAIRKRVDNRADLLGGDRYRR